MGVKNIKTHFDYKVFVTFFLTMAIGGGLLSFKMNEEFDCSTLNFDVIGSDYTAESLIEFKTDVDFDQELHWDFGDNEKAENVLKKSIVHSFKEPGKYKISLYINNLCSFDKEIVISPKVEELNPLKIPNIIFPDKIEVNEEVTFISTSEFAAKWKWKFGETNAVDAVSKTAEYTFSSPGKKTISLVVNDDYKHVKIIEVDVFPKETVVDEIKPKKKRRKSFDNVDLVLQTQIKDKPEEEKKDVVVANKPVDKPKPVSKISVSTQQVSSLISAYANGQKGAEAFNQYICNNKILVFDGSGKGHRFLSFLNEIKGNKLKMEGLRLHKDKNTGCVLSIRVEMKIKSGSRWKKY